MDCTALDPTIPGRIVHANAALRPIRPANLASKDERAQLSASALKGFFRLTNRWSLRDADAKQLLGGVTNGPYYEMKRHPDKRVLGSGYLTANLLPPRYL